MWHISELHVQNFYLLFVCHEREENCASVTIESSIADADALIFFYICLEVSQPGSKHTSMLTYSGIYCLLSTDLKLTNDSDGMLHVIFFI